MDLPEGALGDPVRAAMRRADGGLPQALGRAASELGTPGEATEIAIEIAMVLDGAERAEATVHGLAGGPDRESRPSAAALAGAWLRLRAAELAAELGEDALERTSAALDEIAGGWMHEARDLYDVGRSPRRYFTATEGARGALGALAAALGGSTSGAPDDLVAQLSDAGRRLAVAARIRDDLVELSAGTASERVGLRRGVYGLPVIVAVESDPSLAASIFGTIDDAELEPVIARIRDAGGVQAALRRCRELVDSALSLVDRREGGGAFARIGQSILRESEGAA